MKSNTRAAKAKSKKIQRKTHIKRREENEVCQIAENGRHWQEPNQDLLLLKQTMLATTLQSRRGEEIFLSYSRGQKIGHTYLPKYFLLSYLYVYSFKHTHTHTPQYEVHNRNRNQTNRRECFTPKTQKFFILKNNNGISEIPRISSVLHGERSDIFVFTNVLFHREKFVSIKITQSYCVRHLRIP